MLCWKFNFRMNYKIAIFLRIAIVLVAYYSIGVGFLMYIFQDLLDAKFHRDSRSNFNIYLQEMDLTISSKENIYRNASLINFTLFKFRLVIRHMLGKVNILYREGNPKYFDLTDPITYSAIIDSFF